MLQDDAATEVQQGQKIRPQDNGSDVTLFKLETDDSDMSNRFWKKALRRVFLGVDLWLLSIGCRLILIGRRYREETDAFRWERLFSKLRDRCDVADVECECTRQSHARLDWDGIEREYPVAFLTCKYNITGGSHSAIGNSAFDRVQGAANFCKASNVSAVAGLPAVGDQVDCWRPQMDFSTTTVEMRICAEPVCTLAHVFSCATVDCIQLSSPAKQFFFVFRGEAVLMVSGRYLIVTGSVMALFQIATSVSGLEITNHYNS